MKLSKSIFAGALALAVAGGAGLALLPQDSVAAEKQATIYKDPNCGCCTGHAEYLERNGYKVKIVETDNIDGVKRMAGIPEVLGSCHTAMIDRYVVEGHVPVKAIDKLLAEKPDVKGISLPGMPMGSPGMNGEKEEPFVVYSFGNGKPPQQFYVE
jgi:hypothetical protein